MVDFELTHLNLNDEEMKQELYETNNIRLDLVLRCCLIFAKSEAHGAFI